MTGDAWTLRPADPDDAEAIRSLTRAAYARWVRVIGREPRPMIADYDAAVRNHRIDLLYLADKAGADQLAGLIETIPQADHLLIENVAIAPDCQGRGLGRALLAHAEQLAAALGYAEIRLYTNALFAENLRLYVRLGYRVTREQALNGGIAVHMTKRLG